MTEMTTKENDLLPIERKISIIKYTLLYFGIVHVDYSLCTLLARHTRQLTGIDINYKQAYKEFELYKFKPSTHIDPEIGFFSYDEEGKNKRLELLKKLLTHFENLVNDSNK